MMSKFTLHNLKLFCILVISSTNTSGPVVLVLLVLVLTRL